MRNQADRESGKQLLSCISCFGSLSCLRVSQQINVAGGAVASPDLLPSKVIGDDQVSEQVFKGKVPLLLCFIAICKAVAALLACTWSSPKCVT